MSEESNCELTSYDDLADILANLPLLVRERRRSRRLSLRATADQLDCAASTLSRFESGQHSVALETVVAIIRWLGAPDGQP